MDIKYYLWIKGCVMSIVLKKGVKGRLEVSSGCALDCISNNAEKGCNQGNKTVVPILYAMVPRDTTVNLQGCHRQPLLPGTPGAAILARPRFHNSHEISQNLRGVLAASSYAPPPPSTTTPGQCERRMLRPA